MQIKCTSCGATQELTNDQNCDYCGSIIELDKGRENYQSFSSGEVGNLMMMAETAIEATNWEEALQFFNKVLEKDISNSDAWLGKGIAIVYTSKIGDIKTKEAIAYWKNAIKHASNPDAMSKRVAKEINNVVNKFYPTIENHYIEFKDVNNAYMELVSRFLTLESAQEYAVQLAPSNIDYAKTGYHLCKRVIDIPKKYANADNLSALAGAVVGGFKQNKYTQRDAIDKGIKARATKDLINKAAQSVYFLEDKYINIIKSISPNENIVSSREVFANSKEGKEFEIKQVIEKEGAIAGLKYRWNKLSKPKKIILIIIFILYMLAVAVGSN